MVRDVQLHYIIFSKIKTYKKTKIDTEEHNNRQNVNICIRNLDTNRDRKQLNILKRKYIEEIQAQYTTMKKKTGGY
jgi:hypothetical protein